MKKKEGSAIVRLKEFVGYLKKNKVVSGEHAFESRCGLSNKYINNAYMSMRGNGGIGSDVIARIHSEFPQLNIKWLCTGEGEMIEVDFLNLAELDKLCQEAQNHLNELNSIIKKLYFATKKENNE